MGNITKAWNWVKYFWSTEAPNFYIGIVTAVLMLLNLTTLLSAPISAILCPFASVALYLCFRLFVVNHAEWKENGGLWRDILAVFLGALYTAPFILL